MKEPTYRKPIKIIIGKNDLFICPYCRQVYHRPKGAIECRDYCHQTGQIIMPKPGAKKDAS